MLEKDIERYFVKRMKDKSCLTYKFVSPGNAGVPDRIIITPNGWVFFVELKCPGGKLRPLQLAVKAAIESHKATYLVVDSKDAVDFLAERL